MRLKESLESAEKLQRFIGELEEEGLEKAADTCERFMYGLFKYQKFPQAHWKRLWTTNMLERINKELKRRSRVVEAFLNEKSLLLLRLAVGDIAGHK